MTTPAASDPAGFPTSRLEALSDGVLAIVITLLALTFIDATSHLNESASPAELSAELLQLWPHAVSYVLSFLMTGAYWVLHHVMFHHIRRVDWGLLWINMTFLLLVAVTPFPTDLLATFLLHESNLVIVLYGLCQAATGLSLVGLWLYAARRGLLRSETAPATIRCVCEGALLAPALCLLGVAATTIHSLAAVALFLLAPLAYIFLRGMSRRLAPTGEPHPAAARWSWRGLAAGPSK